MQGSYGTTDSDLTNLIIVIIVFSVDNKSNKLLYQNKNQSNEMH